MKPNLKRCAAGQREQTRHFCSSDARMNRMCVIKRINSDAERHVTYLEKKVWHDKIIKDRTFWALGDPISIRPGRPAAVPAREVVPTVRWRTNTENGETHPRSGVGVTVMYIT